MAQNRLNTLEQYENEEEVKSLLRLLESPRLKSHLKAPPDFRRKVLARIAQVPDHPGFFELLRRFSISFPLFGFRPILASAVVILLSVPIIRSHYLPALRGEQPLEDTGQTPSSPLLVPPTSLSSSAPSAIREQPTIVEQPYNKTERNDPLTLNQTRNSTMKLNTQIPDTSQFIESLTLSNVPPQLRNRGIPLSDIPTQLGSRGIPLSNETQAKPRIHCQYYWRQSIAQDPSRSIPLAAAMKTYELYLSFANDSARLTKEAKETLDNLGKALTSDKLVGCCFQIEGYTDNSGEPQHDLQLSQQQADSVRHYLENNYDLKERLIAVGYGQTKPIADNATAEGRQKNRRIRIVNLGYEQSAND